MAKESKPPTLAELARKRAKNGKCILAGCNIEAHKRGLCPKHYQQFRNALGMQTDKDDYERRMIESGLILPPGDIREINSPNPFRVE